MNEVLDALQRKGEARFNYAILKNTYFRGMTDEECIAEIVAWCRKNGLDVEMEHASVAIGNLPARPAYTVRFTVGLSSRPVAPTSRPRASRRPSGRGSRTGRGSGTSTAG